MENNVSISFEISVEKENSHLPVVVSIRSSDARSSSKIIERFNERVVQEIIFSQVYRMGGGASCSYGSLEGYTPEELDALYSEEGLEDGNPLVEQKSFFNVQDAVSWIKEKIGLLRNYWKAQRGQYNKLLVELRELKIEDFLDEKTGDEITLSQTVRLKK